MRCVDATKGITTQEAHRAVLSVLLDQFTESAVSPMRLTLASEEILGCTPQFHIYAPKNHTIDSDRLFPRF